MPTLSVASHRDLRLFLRLPRYVGEPVVRSEVKDCVGQYAQEADCGHDEGQRDTEPVGQQALDWRHDGTAHYRHDQAGGCEFGVHPETVQRHPVDRGEHQRQAGGHPDERPRPGQAGEERGVETEQNGEAGHDRKQLRGPDVAHQPGHDEPGDEEKDQADLQEIGTLDRGATGDYIFDVEHDVGPGADLSSDVEELGEDPVAPVVVVVQAADGRAEVHVVAVRGDLLVAFGNLLYE